MDTVLDIAQVIAMVAALAAVWYAKETAAETRALRHEERVARLLELIADVGDAGTGWARGHAGVLLDVPRMRLRAALSATGASLPKCEQLLDVEWPSYTTHTDAVKREDDALAAVEAALREVADLLVRLRAKGS